MSDQKKNVFITGGSTGIGAASVRKFAQCGWNVTFMDINVEGGEAVAQETGALFVEGNTRNREDLDKAVAAAIDKYGELDCVVANAGIHRCNTMLTITEEELDLMIDTNIKGPELHREGQQFWLRAHERCARSNHKEFGHRPRASKRSSQRRLRGNDPHAFGDQPFSEICGHYAQRRCERLLESGSGTVSARQSRRGSGGCRAHLLPGVGFGKLHYRRPLSD